MNIFYVSWISNRGTKGRVYRLELQKKERMTDIQLLKISSLSSVDDD